MSVNEDITAVLLPDLATADEQAQQGENDVDTVQPWTYKAVFTNFWDARTREEARLWFNISWPVGLSVMFRSSHQFVDLIFLGHLGTTYLAGAGIANMLMVVSSAWLWKSFGTSLNTLCAQAIGAKHPSLVGAYVNISLLLVTILCIPIAAIWVFTGDLMQVFGFSQQQCELASEFARWSIIGVFPMMYFAVLSNFLQSLNSVYPVLLINGVMTAVNAALNFFLVFGTGVDTGLGFRGSPIATALTSWLSLISILIFIFARGLHKGYWESWDAESKSWHRMKVFLKQAFPTAFGNFAEDLQLQVMVFLAANLGDVDIATHNGFLYMFFVLTAIMIGIVKATIIRVGYHLGRRDVFMALRVCGINVLVAGGMGVIISCVLVGTKDVVGRIFSSDPDVWRLASQVALLAGAGYMGLAVFYVCMGILLGQARAGIVALAFLVGAWFVAVPVAAVLVYVADMALLGIWLGLVAGYLTITFIACIAVIRSDWNALAEDAVARARAKAAALITPSETVELLA